MATTPSVDLPSMHFAPRMDLVAERPAGGLDNVLALARGMVGALSARVVRRPDGAFRFGASVRDLAGLRLGNEVPGTTIVARLGGEAEPGWLTLDFPDMARRNAAMPLVPSLVALVGQVATAEAERDAALDRERLALAAIEHDECGVLAVDRDGRLLFANAVGEAILTANDGVGMVRGFVRPTGYAEAVRFRTALDQLFAPTGTTRRGIVLLLPREDGARPLLMVLTACGDAQGVIAHVMKPELSEELGIDVICQLLGLSPVETRLVDRLFAGMTLGDAAAALRIKPDTARAYLKQIFGKTGIHRQTELVALLGRYRRAVAADTELRPA